MERDQRDLERDGDDLFDRERTRQYVAFVRGSLARRRGLVAAVAVGIMALTALGLAALPSTYHVEAKLLAQRIAVLPVRGEGTDAAAPTRGAAETVQRRDNLLGLIEATDLLHHWDEHRAPAQRAFDAIRGLVHGPDTEEDRRDAMVERLEKRLVSWTNEGTVTIAIDWPDARMACRIVDIAEQDFLEERYTHEVTALAESLAILRSHADGLRQDVDDAVAAARDLRAARQKPAAEGDHDAKPPDAKPADDKPVAAPQRAPRRPAEVKPEIEQLQATLAAKQRALDDLEGFRRHRLSEAQARLAEQRGTYTEHHPVIMDLEQTVTALSAPSPQVKALREEIASLRAEYERTAVQAPGAPAAVAPLARSSLPPPELPSEILRLDQELREDRDPAVVYARGRLRDAMDKYAALREKIEAAQIDLETAQAAFKYRYSVLTPAKLPKRPVKPNVPLVLLAALVASALAALVAAVAADVHGGRVVERWQIERLLDRPILGEIEVPRLPRPRAR
jgi:hypothetical protein